MWKYAICGLKLPVNITLILLLRVPGEEKLRLVFWRVRGRVARVSVGNSILEVLNWERGGQQGEHRFANARRQWRCGNARRQNWCKNVRTGFNGLNWLWYCFLQHEIYMREENCCFQTRFQLRVISEVYISKCWSLELVVILSFYIIKMLFLASSINELV